MIREDITPKLKQLHAERKLFLEFRELEADLQRCVILHEAWQFLDSKRKYDFVERALSEGKASVQAHQDKIKANRDRVQVIDEEISLQLNQIEDVSKTYLLIKMLIILFFTILRLYNT